MSCNFCKGSHSTIEHICGKCKKTGHPGYLPHCSQCNSIEHTEEVHSCKRSKCILLGDHSHSCDYCFGEHPTEQHECSECGQKGHYWGDHESKVFCDICHGYAGHSNKQHHICQHCKRDAFVRHMPCPIEGCNGCAIEEYLATINKHEPSATCNKCGHWWENLDSVCYA
jgi:hypothetical protein